MANQKPVDEIRIGRVRLRFGRMGPTNSPGTMSPFPASTKTAINGRARRASGATTCWCLRKWPTSRIRGCSSFRQKQKSRRCRSATPSSRPRARRSQSLRRACSFLPASIESLLVLPSRSQLRRHHSSLLLRSVGFPSVCPPAPACLGVLWGPWVFPLASAERFFSLLGSAVLMCVGEIFTGLGAITTGVFFFYLKKL